MSKEELPRQLGLKDAVGILVGSVIGSAIFVVTAEMTQCVHTPAMVLAIWVLGGVISFMGGVTFAELGTRFPAAGGMYVYLRSSLGMLVAFLYGWSLFLVIQTGSIAAVAAAFARYFTVLAGTPDSWQTPIAVALIAFLTTTNAISTRLGANVQNVCSLVKCLGLVGLIVLCLGSSKADTSHFSPVIVDSLSYTFVLAIGNALVAALWAYDGWYQVGNIAGELKDPQREVPRSLFLGLSVVCVLYVLVSIAYLAVLTPQQVATSKAVASDAARSVWGDFGSRLISLAVVISTFGCVNGMTISGPRVYYAMSRDGLLPGFLADVHPRFHTPFWPVVLQGIWSILLVMKGNYNELFNYVMFVGWVFYMLAGVALILERRKQPHEPCYRAWGYPWTTYGFILASGFLFVTTFLNNTEWSIKGLWILAGGATVHLVRVHVIGLKTG